MRSALLHVDQFLRGAGPFHPDGCARRPGWWLPLMILAVTPVYGAVMGSYHFDPPERLLLVLYSASKMPLLLFTTSVLCLPGFFVFNTILGLRNDFREALQAVLAGQAGLAVTLLALAPLTRFWYFSTLNYRAALLFNAAVFSVATVAGHLVMLRYYRTLIRRRRAHRVMLYAWATMYAFVGIQMGWTLRPFIGDPNAATAFFRPEPFSNAYVVVARLIFGS